MLIRESGKHEWFGRVSLDKIGERGRREINSLVEEKNVSR